MKFALTKKCCLNIHIYTYICTTSQKYLVALQNFQGVSSWCNGYCNGLQNHSEQVPTPVALLCSVLGKYPWERYECPYPPSYESNSTTTVLLGEGLWH